MPLWDAATPENDERGFAMTIVLATFVASFATCVYIYFGYPALLWMLSRWRPRPIARGDDLPSVSMVVALHNEEDVVDAKIANCRELDYPPELLEFVFVSDGSTDATNERVRAATDDGIRLVAIERSGKARALNRGVAAAKGDVIVFTDANNFLDRGALRAIVRSFSDPEVGGVCGNKRLRARAGDTTGKGENLYWRYDKWQKKLESSIGSIFAADGTLYAVRRSLYVPIEDPAQADDIAISTRVVLQGSRLVWDDDAVAWEDAPAEGAAEFRRKVRVTNHSVRALLLLGRALFTHGFYSVELLSHKLVRHLIPFFLILQFVSNLVLAIAWRGVFLWLLVAQTAFYAAALAGALLRDHPLGRKKPLFVPYYFSLVNAAALLGVLSIVAGKRHQAWRPRGS